MAHKINDVTASVTISASAGTGKTKTLIDRILALLLHGVKPSHILCITYTNAAALEMSERLTKKLIFFNSSPLDILKLDLAELGFDESYVNIAKSLHHKNTKDGPVRIQTIHSLCFSILGRFSIESGLYSGISICDDFRSQQLIDESIRHVLSDPSFFNDFNIISKYECDIVQLIKESSIKIKRFIDQENDFESLYLNEFDLTNQNIFHMSDLEISEELFNICFKDIDYRKVFTNLSNLLRTGLKTDIDNARILDECLQDLSIDWTKIFFTKDGSPSKRLCTSKVKGVLPQMEKLAIIAKQFRKMKKTFEFVIVNSAFFKIIQAVFRKFEDLKKVNHCLDYNDVILRCIDLLSQNDNVMFSLENELCHLLIDEAQDTSPEQWELIDKFLNEFFAHYKPTKTVFVVGDEKQTIYSFQGSDADVFKNKCKKLQQKIEACGQKFHKIQLNKSYRSYGNILTFVDSVFSDTFQTQHTTNRSTSKGVIDFVDLFQDDDDKSDSKLNANQKMAQYIARFINDSIENNIIVGSLERPASPSDFLVLFQRRNQELMQNIISELRKLSIPVSGIDRLSIQNELVIEDLIAFAEFCLLPLDDLTCARVMKSPIINMTEDDLMNACINRSEKHLWEYVSQNAYLNKKYNIISILKYIDMSVNCSAYVFFMTLLTDGYIEKFISRLGHQCIEIIQQFLNIISTYEKDNTPSVFSFLQWFHSFDHELKLESANQNCVKLMTVHASKGLQAPFVILADTQSVKGTNQFPRILDGKNGILFWNFCTDDLDDHVLDIHLNKKYYDERESMRLLYVALTRAENYLCILGKNQKNISNKSWYRIIEKATVNFKDIEKYGYHLKRFGEYQQSTTIAPPKNNHNVINIPEWFYEKLEDNADNDNTKIESASIIYGNAVHMLLHEIPKFPEELWDKIADDLLEKSYLSMNKKIEAKNETLNVINSNRFLFRESSKSEVSFVFNDKVGRIDKLYFDGQKLLIVDFKTGHELPFIPADYTSQLDFYKTAMSHLLNYKNENIRTAILWTKNAKLIYI